MAFCPANGCLSISGAVQTPLMTLLAVMREVCNSFDDSYNAYPTAKRHLCREGNELHRAKQEKMHTPLIKSFIPFALKSNWTDNPKTKFSPTDADVTFGPGKDAYLLNRTEARLNKKREDVMGILQKGQPA